jgi:beta-lactamase class A
VFQRKNEHNFGRFLIFGLVVALLGFLAWRWIKFDEWRTRLPARMSLAGVPVGGATQDEALERVLGAYDGPILLHYQDRRLSLSPADVAFNIDVDATIATVDAEMVRIGGAEGFVRYLLGQYPGPTDLPVRATYSGEALRAFLAEIAHQYDQPAKPPIPQPTNGSYSAGEPGYELDVEASLPAVESALLSTSDREAVLVVKVQSPPVPDFELLGKVVENQLASFPGVASVFAKDLKSGEEIAINADVAYAGMSIVKIAIMEEAYRYLSQPPDPDTTKILSETMALSGNFTANLLLRMIGEGDAYRGTEVLNQSMQRLGLVNTFMATPYDEDVPPPVIITQANSRTDLNTAPDPYMQTTPQEMGLLLEMIYQCSHGGGALELIYPGQLTVQECQAMIDHMLENQLSGAEEVPVLIAAGLPTNTPIAHKHGWVDDTRADAALVFTPGGDYVLVVYLYQEGWVNWDQTNSLMSLVSEMLYNHFNVPGGS